MGERLSIDFFGTLNVDDDVWIPFLEEAKRDDIEIHIISGLWEKDLKERLEVKGYYKHLHYDYLHSILAHLHDRGVDTFYDEGYDSWFSDNSLWWEAKSIICQRHKIKIHFDSDPRFRPFFKLIPTRFVLVNPALKEYIKKLTKVMESENEGGDELLIQ